MKSRLSMLLAFIASIATMAQEVKSSDPIEFADSTVRQLCVASWDSDGDGELSYDEAAAVTDLGGTFSNNEAITSFDELQYFTGLTGIGNRAFIFCRGLVSVTLPKSVTSISNHAFYVCESLTSITLPMGVASIGDFAFYSCSSLASVTIPRSVNSIGNNAFFGCSSLTSVTSYIKNPFIIDPYVFYGINASCILRVRAGTKALYEQTAGWHEYFAQIVEMENDQPEGNINFADATVKQICVTNWDTDGDGELSYDEAEAVTDLGEVFRENKSITSFNELQYFTGLTSIGDFSFSDCSGLSSIIIPKSVTSIGSWAFHGCTSLTSVTIPKTVTSIGIDAFLRCTGLTSVTIPEGVTSIGIEAFAECSSLTSITIPESVTSISFGAFERCKSLISIIVIDGNPVYDSRNNCNAIIETATNTLILGCQNTIIPETITSIGIAAFNTCEHLTSITIPGSVTSIGDRAFELCTGLTSIAIPESVTSIGERAFLYCTGLTSVTSYIKVPFTISDVFLAINNSCILYVPAGTKALYEQTDGWHENFAQIVEMGSENIENDDPEPYAVLSDDNTVLTFYYDDQKVARGGMTLKSQKSVVQDWWGQHESILKVSFDDSFANCSSITCTSCWFFNCNNLVSILGINNLNTANVTDMSSMFTNCSSLTQIDVSGFNTSKATDMSSMFSGCSGLTSLDLSNFNTANVTNMNTMFYGCSHLTTIYVGNEWSTANVTSELGVFDGCEHLVGGNGTTYDDHRADYTYARIDRPGAPGYFTDKNAPIVEKKPYAVLSDNNTKLTFYYDTFKEQHGGMSVGPYMSIAAREWNDYSATITTVEFDASFANFTTLESTDFWFSEFEDLTTIVGMAYLNTDHVYSMGAMFQDCYSLTSIDMSMCNTENVDVFQSMFFGCHHLTDINLSGINTTNVTNMAGMFGDCFNLTTLDLSSFNTSKVTYMNGAFRRCYKLTTIYVGEGWTTSNVTNGEMMFEGSINLVGGMGTTYNENIFDHTYAHIDGGTSNPGYFTDIADFAKDAPFIVDLNLRAYWNYEVNYGIHYDWQNEWIYGWDEMDKAIFGDIWYTEPTEYNVRRYYTANVPYAAHTSVLSNTIKGTTFYGDWNFGYWDVLAWSSGGSTDEIPSTSFNETLEGITAYTHQTMRSVPWASSSTRAFQQPDQLFSGYDRAVEIGNEDLMGYEYDPARNAWLKRLDMVLEPATYIYLTQVIIHNNNNKIIGVDGYADLSGMARSTNLFTGVAGEEPVTVTFDSRFKPSITIPETGETVAVAGGRLMTFGIPNQNGNRIMSSNEVTDTQQHLLGITMQFNNGVDSTFVFDVTDQIRRRWKGGVITVELNMDTIRIPSHYEKEQLTIALACDGRVVTMTSEEGATIYYTLDGSEPTTASKQYSGDGLALTDLCTVNAFAAAKGKTPSALATLAVHSLFDGTTARVDAGGSLAEAFQWCGGIANATNLGAIMWMRNDDFPADAASSVQNPNVLLYVNDYMQALGIDIRNVVADGLAQRITLTDNIREDGTHGPAAFYVPQAFRVQNDIRYTRTFSQQTVPHECRGWETIVLPFTVQTITHATNGECIPFAAYTAGLKPFWLCELTEQGFKDSDSLRANIPYIISMPENEEYSPYYRLAGEVTFSARGIEVPATQLQTSHRGQSSFVPCFGTVAQAEDVFALNVGDPRKGFAEGSLFDRNYRDVYPFEAYRTTTQAGVRYISIADDFDSNTAIREMKDERMRSEKQSGAVYDLRGLRVKTPGKGLYIRQGKKVVVN